MFGISAFAVWFIVAILLVILELIIPGVWIIWFVIPTFLTGIFSYIFDLTLAIQFMVFVTFTGITIGLLFKLGHKRTQKLSDNEDLNQRGVEYLEQTYILEIAVKNGEGRLKLGDSYWILKGKDCPIGTKIKIINLDSNALCFEIID